MRLVPVLLAVVLFAGCQKDVVASVDAGAAEALVAPRAPVALEDAGSGITVEQVDRYLAYRKMLTAAHRALAPKLDAVEAKGRKRKDGGSVAEEGLALIGEEAKAQAAALAQSGLGQHQLELIEAMVQEMVTEREMALDTASPEEVAEMEAMAKKLPPDQKATLEQSIADLIAQRERSLALTDMRARFGDRSVDVLLQRDSELRAAWSEWISVLAGEAK